MSVLDQFQFGNTISLDVYGAAVLGNNFKNVKAVGLVDWQMAPFVNVDVFAIHRNIFPLLPAGSAPDDARAYQYLLIEYGNGQRTVLGLPWINESTITVVGRQKLVIEVIDASPASVEVARMQLSAGGLKVQSINLVNMT